MKKGFTPVAAIVAASLFGLHAQAAAEVHAAKEVTVRTLRVAYADLDVALRTDATELYQRLRTATRRVCGPDEQNLDRLQALLAGDGAGAAPLRPT